MISAAVFLDRDGVINANRADHVLRWDQFEFLHGVLRALAMLKAAGLPVIVVTNQAVVDRGVLSAAELDGLHRRMHEAIQAAGGALHDVLYCPHEASAHCACRKPRPGLFLQAAQRHAIDLEASYYVGDALTDIEAGQAAGCTCVMVRTGRGRTQHLREEARLLRNYFVAKDLLAASRWIVAQPASRAASPIQSSWWRTLIAPPLSVERW
jgi:D-glycero-D-manno-heptose 1,7-bisphosphate phosphatase